MFYKKNLNISHNKEVYEFLSNHFKYSMNNNDCPPYTIANNIKVYNLPVKNAVEDCINTALYDEEFSYAANEEIALFEENHPGFTVYTAGRSGGYLLLAAKGPGNVISAICNNINCSYEEFKQEAKGRGECVYWYEEERRKVAEVVRDFDKLCDTLVDILDEYTTYNVKASESTTKYAIIHSSRNPADILKDAEIVTSLYEALKVYEKEEPFGFDMDEVRLVRIHEVINDAGSKDVEALTLMYKGAYSKEDLIRLMT